MSFAPHCLAVAAHAFDHVSGTEPVISPALHMRSSRWPDEQNLRGRDE
jgi:hypothetical protein